MAIRRQFISFALVGTGGFLVDAGVLLLATRVFEFGPYLGRVFSFLAAVTFTWLMNRTFTFKSVQAAPRATQWLRFVTANLLGGAVNLGLYTLLVTYVAAVHAQPVIGVGAGAIAGLAFNFTASRVFVFRGSASASSERLGA